MIFILTLLHYFFYFYLFLEAKAEILEKISLVFWDIWRHQKDIFELTVLYLNMKSMTHNIFLHFIYTGKIMFIRVLKRD